MARSMAMVLLVASVAAPLVSGCDALGSVVVEAGDFAGAKTDVHCDRRVVTADGRPAAFCQEVIATVAAAEFSDDCRAKHKATAAPGLCPRADVIAGCKLHKENKDDSSVYDWYYVVADRDMDSRARVVEDVDRMCTDPTRYKEGAELTRP